MRLPRPKSIIAAIAATVLGICIVLAWRYARNYARTEVGDAIAWTGHLLNQQTPTLSQVKVTLRTPFHRPFADAEVIIETWTDDQGTDLLMPAVRRFPFWQMYTWWIAVTAKSGCPGGGWSGQVVPSIDAATPTRIDWMIGSPTEVSPIASSMRIKGHVRFREGRDRQTARIQRSDLRIGASFRLNHTEYVVEELESSDDGRKHTLTLQSSDDCTPLLAVRFVDGEGKPVRSDYSPKWTGHHSTKLRTRVDQVLVRRDELHCPPASIYGAIIFEYWSDTWVRTIPFDVSVPLSRQMCPNAPITTSAKEAYALLPTTEQPVLEAVPEAAWGPRASGNPADLFEVANKFVHVDSRPSPSMEAGFVVSLKNTAERPTVASYDVILTGCRDSIGNSLLPGGSARSSTLYLWQINFDRRPSHQQETDAEPFFSVATHQLPSSKATSVTFEGTVKLKVADTLKTADLKDVLLDVSKPFKIGPVQFTFEGMREDVADFEIHGDLGLLRELSIFDRDGRLLDTRQFSGPYAYWSHTCTRDMIAGGAENIKAVNIQAQYYADSRHYVLPFKVTVPREK